MYIGAHESTAGGVHLALERGEADGCEAIQVFTSYNMRWAPRPLDEVEASLFLSEHARLKCGRSAFPLMSHAIYLVNLATPDAQLRQRSVEAMERDLCLCETLGIDYLVMHPGSAVGTGEKQALRTVARSLSQLHRRTPGFACRVLLENTAGQGDTLGRSFAQLAQIMDQTLEGDRLGVCLDTCHGWAAGYDLATAQGYQATMEEMERWVGVEQLRAFHLNDSVRQRGDQVDRHASIGDGTLVLDAFARLINDPRFAHCPAVVETPPDADGSSSFARNIATLKGLRRAP